MGENNVLGRLCGWKNAQNPLVYRYKVKNSFCEWRGESYLKMFKEVLWLQIRYSATRKRFWFQQDGARPHTCRTVLDFLREKFHGRILSNLTDRIWPPYSPDLNPLDYFFWGYANEKVFEKQQEH